ncbi:NYN domain-containing protein [Archangium lansingense]|uniref:NYN domain-containing protein n=1 Tax=Archangium lansingense TaxID=2995310 RepID=A0ABT4AN49_9BACT|nr:NYN domain-containing protein [Archangium lansinium]MCY1083105.1 NYN domain-containing protein [Archangium lansinium]
MALTREGFLENNQHRIALFLDFENLVTNTGFTAGNFDLQPAMDRLLERGKVVFRRAYCDWSRFKEAKGNLHEFGVELIDVPPSTRSGKNGADMRLVIDALELCYAREHIDTFAIASGDSDFCPLAYKLRENGKQLIGLAVKEATSPLFVKACDEFIYLRPRTRAEKDKEKRAHEQEEVGKGRGKHGKGHGAGERQGKEQAHGHKGKAEGSKVEVPESVMEVVQRLLARTTGTLNPSLIKEALVRKEPDFDERDHGFSSFTKLLTALEHEGVLKRVQQGRQWYVVAPDAAPLEPTPEPKGRGRNARPVEEEDEEEVYPDPVDDF